MTIFTRALLSHNYFKFVRRQSSKLRKFYSFSDTNHESFQHNLTSKQCLFLANRQFATQLPVANLEINKSQIIKYFEQLTKMLETKNGKDDAYEILNIREVHCLLKERTKIHEDLNTLAELVKQDKDMNKLVAEEKATYEEQLQDIESKLTQTILENIGNEHCNDVLIQITGGVGGQESMLFVKELLEMYLNYLNYLGFTHEIIELETTEQGGIRRANVCISGDNALEMLRHEAGVHRVQRVPATEKSGRIHTSVVSVAVMPQPSEIDVELPDKDLKIEAKRASGPGGQNVNKSMSAVRITHLPTGITVDCQAQRTYLQNHKIAMLQLRMKLYETRLAESVNSTQKMRRKQMGLGLRNEKIRTYNYNQSRVTDHRLENGTTHNLEGFLEGGEELNKMQEKLRLEFRKSLFLEAIKHC